MDTPTKTKNSQKVSVQLNTQLYAVPTPAGAVYATANGSSSKQRDFLYQLIIHNHEQKINAALLKKWGGSENIQTTVKIFYRLQQLNYITGSTEKPASIPSGQLDDILTKIISPLSNNNKAVLSDSNGLYIASSGYPHEVAEELAAMSVDLYLLYSRHQKLLVNNLNIATEAIAMIAPDGYSQLGFWPLHIGSNVFFLILGGVPQLQHKAFTVLVKLLASKY
ncbi:MAG: roadblock/LC7 domain-containing protein [Pseudomonadota bacterium]